MPVRYEIDPIDDQLALIRTRCIGPVSFEEVRAHFHELASDPELPGALDVLLDLTQLESVPESQQLGTVAREVELMKKQLVWRGCAVVVGGDLLYGMSRVFQAFAESHFETFTVVRSIAEAEAWLSKLR